MSCDCSAKRCDGVRPSRRPQYVAVSGSIDVGGGGRSACGRVSVHVRLLWTTLSVMVTIGCTYSFIQPSWYVHGMTRDRLGLFNYCVRDPRSSASISAPPRTLWPPRPSVVVTSAPRQLCGVYGGQFDLSSLPSNTWQIACVLYGGGCVLLSFSSLAAVFCLLLPSHCAKRLASYTGYIQTMAAVILIGAVVSFPVGLDSKLAQHYCPGARIYSAGACQVGWAYMLGIMSAALVVFCPVLSHYTDIDDDLDEAEDSEVVAGSSTVRLIA